MPKAKPGFYAVRVGRREECESQVKGFSSKKFKKFNTAAEAEEFVKGSPATGQVSAARPGEASYGR
ncbi:hypothetical protein GLOTRDRAFT_126217 [Gloeophyllum trabeum ATCC 11539]|uniref:Ribonuclease H1 N-terminal domain-containing protein n=1 Tax=Gloeophyllum trabeum (strain ATCC 11539 / FP-39264 / Madison 617) TaxID=670483 RepID=S7RSS2_GLOTA|nr:uncharacterized protein GLOTRDRAFT_126217 [Gloeophyllum trabeum ATCC 11539]EPQ57725.1 hypothetical protein GLOTRDRAFT_126217 [Gloeophyllum trabeum ATCC 11539]